MATNQVTADWMIDDWMAGGISQEDFILISLHDTTGRDVITFNVNSNYSKHTENKTNGFMQ